VAAPEIQTVEDVPEFVEAITVIGQYFGWHPTTEQAAQFVGNLDIGRMLAARDGGTIVGGAGAFTFDMTVPGATVPTAGVTVVGVHPTHRRRGILRAMMRRQLDDVHERGEPLAALWASEETIYARYGYGMASLQGEMSLSRLYTAFARPGERVATTRFVEPDEAIELLPPVWDAVRVQRPGFFARPRSWWETRTLDDPPERRFGGGPKRIVVLDTDAGVQAYAIYRHYSGFEDGVSKARLGVIEALGATPESTRDVWRFLLDVDWVETISASLLPIDHPLVLLLATPRRMKFRVGDGLWVRLVDVGAALSGRTYRDGGPLVLDVRDDFCPWNEGRWRLEAGAAAQTDEDADLALDVADLGSVYMGGFTFGELAAAGRVEEVRDGALTRADDVFGIDVRPWCPEIF
jgi:predicted acetyltransferase